MTDELRKKMERLRAVAPKLNQATDEAARVIQAVEKLLADLSLGITAEATVKTEPFDAGPDEDESWRADPRPRREIDVRLVYGRHGGTYRFFIREVLTEADPKWADRWNDLEVLDETTWSSCPRELKLASFAELPTLLDSIVDTAELLAKRAEGATKTVRDLLDAIGND